jgi:uncharacterized membrane protein
MFSDEDYRSRDARYDHEVHYGHESLAMTELLAAIAVFVVAHLVPSAPPLRSRLIAWVGRRAYLLCYSLVSLGIIVWIIVAARRAPYLSLWDPAPWQAAVPLLVMPFALWLVLVGLVEPNPLSISFRAAGEGELGPAAAVTRHPVLWGILLWAGSHIPPNGDAVSIILFGGAALLAVGGFAMADRRARQRLGEKRWRTLAGTTSLVPLAALLSGRSRLTGSTLLLLSVAAALAVYLWFIVQGHEQLIGPDPLAWFS